MKKLAIAIGFALLMSAPVWAGGVGVGIGTWDTSDADGDEGVGFRLAIDMGESVDFEIRTSFFDGFSRVANGALYRLEATPVDLGLTWHFKEGGKIEPYVGGGASYIYTDAAFEGGAVLLAGGPEVDDEFGYYLLAGLDAPIGERLGFYAEAMYRSAKLEVTANAFGFNDFQDDVAGPAATLGLMLKW